MARMIDGDKLVENLRLIATCWSISPFVSKEKHNGAVNMFREVVREVKESPTLTPPNEPLTLDELREMNGEPVWGKSLITDKPGEWFILRVVEMSKTWFIACAGAEQGFGDKDTYGKTWLAYRRPPKGEEET